MSGFSLPPPPSGPSLPPVVKSQLAIGSPRRRKNVPIPSGGPLSDVEIGPDGRLSVVKPAGGLEVDESGRLVRPPDQSGELLSLQEREPIPDDTISPRPDLAGDPRRSQPAGGKFVQPQRNFRPFEPGFDVTKPVPSPLMQREDILQAVKRAENHAAAFAEFNGPDAVEERKRRKAERDVVAPQLLAMQEADVSAVDTTDNPLASNEGAAAIRSEEVVAEGIARRRRDIAEENALAAIAAEKNAVVEGSRIPFPGSEEKRLAREEKIRQEEENRTDIGLRGLRGEELISDKFVADTFDLGRTAVGSLLGSLAAGVSSIVTAPLEALDTEINTSGDPEGSIRRFIETIHSVNESIFGAIAAPLTKNTPPEDSFSIEVDADGRLQRVKDQSPGFEKESKVTTLVRDNFAAAGSIASFFVGPKLLSATVGGMLPKIASRSILPIINRLRSVSQAGGKGLILDVGRVAEKVAAAGVATDYAARAAKIQRYSSFVFAAANSAQGSAREAWQAGVEGKAGELALSALSQRRGAFLSGAAVGLADGLVFSRTFDRLGFGGPIAKQNLFRWAIGVGKSTFAEVSTEMMQAPISEYSAKLLYDQDRGSLQAMTAGSIQAGEGSLGASAVASVLIAAATGRLPQWKRQRRGRTIVEGSAWRVPSFLPDRAGAYSVDPTAKLAASPVAGSVAPSLSPDRSPGLFNETHVAHLTPKLASTGLLNITGSAVGGKVSFDAEALGSFNFADAFNIKDGLENINLSEGESNPLFDRLVYTATLKDGRIIELNVKQWHSDVIDAVRAATGSVSTATMARVVFGKGDYIEFNGNGILVQNFTLGGENLSTWRADIHLENAAKANLEEKNILVSSGTVREEIIRIVRAQKKAADDLFVLTEQGVAEAVQPSVREILFNETGIDPTDAQITARANELRIADDNASRKAFIARARGEALGREASPREVFDAMRYTGNDVVGEGSVADILELTQTGHEDVEIEDGSAFDEAGGARGSEAIADRGGSFTVFEMRALGEKHGLPPGEAVARELARRMLNRDFNIPRGISNDVEGRAWEIYNSNIKMRNQRADRARDLAVWKFINGEKIEAVEGQISDKEALEANKILADLVARADYAAKVPAVNPYFMTQVARGIFPSAKIVEGQGFISVEHPDFFDGKPVIIQTGEFLHIEASDRPAYYQSVWEKMKADGNVLGYRLSTDIWFPLAPTYEQFSSDLASLPPQLRAGFEFWFFDAKKIGGFQRDRTISVRPPERRVIGGVTLPLDNTQLFEEFAHALQEDFENKNPAVSAGNPDAVWEQFKNFVFETHPEVLAFDDPRLGAPVVLPSEITFLQPLVEPFQRLYSGVIGRTKAAEDLSKDNRKEARKSDLSYEGVFELDENGELALDSRGEPIFIPGPPDPEDHHGVDFDEESSDFNTEEEDAKLRMAQEFDSATDFSGFGADGVTQQFSFVFADPVKEIDRNAFDSSIDPDTNKPRAWSHLSSVGQSILQNNHQRPFDLRESNPEFAAAWNRAAALVAADTDKRLGEFQKPAPRPVVTGPQDGPFVTELPAQGRLSKESVSISENTEIPDDTTEDLIIAKMAQTDKALIGAIWRKAITDLELVIERSEAALPGLSPGDAAVELDNITKLKAELEYAWPGRFVQTLKLGAHRTLTVYWHPDQINEQGQSPIPAGYPPNGVAGTVLRGSSVSGKKGTIRVGGIGSTTIRSARVVRERSGTTPIPFDIAVSRELPFQKREEVGLSRENNPTALLDVDTPRSSMGQVYINPGTYSLDPSESHSDPPKKGSDFSALGHGDRGAPTHRRSVKIVSDKNTREVRIPEWRRGVQWLGLSIDRTTNDNKKLGDESKFFFLGTGARGGKWLNLDHSSVAPHFADAPKFFGKMHSRNPNEPTVAAQTAEFDSYVADVTAWLNAKEGRTAAVRTAVSTNGNIIASKRNPGFARALSIALNVSDSALSMPLGEAMGVSSLDDTWVPSVEVSGAAGSRIKLDAHKTIEQGFIMSGVRDEPGGPGWNLGPEVFTDPIFFVNEEPQSETMVQPILDEVLYLDEVAKSVDLLDSSEDGLSFLRAIELIRGQMDNRYDSAKWTWAKRINTRLLDVEKNFLDAFEKNYGFDRPRNLAVARDILRGFKIRSRRNEGDARLPVRNKNLLLADNEVTNRLRQPVSSAQKNLDKAKRLLAERLKAGRVPRATPPTTRAKISKSGEVLSSGKEAVVPTSLLRQNVARAQEILDDKNRQLARALEVEKEKIGDQSGPSDPISFPREAPSGGERHRPIGRDLGQRNVRGSFSVTPPPRPFFAGDFGGGPPQRALWSAGFVNPDGSKKTSVELSAIKENIVTPLANELKEISRTAIAPEELKAIIENSGLDDMAKLVIDLYSVGTPDWQIGHELTSALTRNMKKGDDPIANYQGAWFVHFVLKAAGIEVAGSDRQNGPNDRMSSFLNPDLAHVTDVHFTRIGKDTVGDGKDGLYKPTPQSKLEKILDDNLLDNSDFRGVFRLAGGSSVGSQQMVANWVLGMGRLSNVMGRHINDNIENGGIGPLALQFFIPSNENLGFTKTRIDNRWGQYNPNNVDEAANSYEEGFSAGGFDEIDFGVGSDDPGSPSPLPPLTPLGFASGRVEAGISSEENFVLDEENFVLDETPEPLFEPDAVDLSEADMLLLQDAAEEAPDVDKILTKELFAGVSAARSRFKAGVVGADAELIEKYRALKFYFLAGSPFYIEKNRLNRADSVAKWFVRANSDFDKFGKVRGGLDEELLNLKRDQYAARLDVFYAEKIFRFSPGHQGFLSRKQDDLAKIDLDVFFKAEAVRESRSLERYNVWLAKNFQRLNNRQPDSASKEELSLFGAKSDLENTKRKIRDIENTLKFNSPVSGLVPGYKAKILDLQKEKVRLVNDVFLKSFNFREAINLIRYNEWRANAILTWSFNDGMPDSAKPGLDAAKFEAHARRFQARQNVRLLSDTIDRQNAPLSLVSVYKTRLEISKKNLADSELDVERTTKAANNKRYTAGNWLAPGEAAAMKKITLLSREVSDLASKIENGVATDLEVSRHKTASDILDLEKSKFKWINKAYWDADRDAKKKGRVATPEDRKLAADMHRAAHEYATYMADPSNENFDRGKASALAARLRAAEFAYNNVLSDPSDPYRLRAHKFDAFLDINGDLVIPDALGGVSAPAIPTKTISTGGFFKSLKNLATFSSGSLKDTERGVGIYYGADRAERRKIVNWLFGQGVSKNSAEAEIAFSEHRRTIEGIFSRARLGRGATELFNRIAGGKTEAGQGDDGVLSNIINLATGAPVRSDISELEGTVPIEQQSRARAAEAEVRALSDKIIADINSTQQRFGLPLLKRNESVSPIDWMKAFNLQSREFGLFYAGTNEKNPLSTILTGGEATREALEGLATVKGYRYNPEEVNAFVEDIGTDFQSVFKEFVAGSERVIFHTDSFQKFSLLINHTKASIKLGVVSRRTGTAFINLLQSARNAVVGQTQQRLDKLISDNNPVPYVSDALGRIYYLLAVTVSLNQVAGGISSAIMNTAVYTSVFAADVARDIATKNPLALIDITKAMADQVAAFTMRHGKEYYTIEGERSDWLVTRRPREGIDPSSKQRFITGIGQMSLAIDRSVARGIVSYYYRFNRRRGMSKKDAMIEADHRARSMMGGRNVEDLSELLRTQALRWPNMYMREVTNLFQFVGHNLNENENILRGSTGFPLVMLGLTTTNFIWRNFFGRNIVIDPVNLMLDVMKLYGYYDDDDEEDFLKGMMQSALGKNGQKWVTGSFLGRKPETDPRMLAAIRFAETSDLANNPNFKAIVNSKRGRGRFSGGPFGEMEWWKEGDVATRKAVASEIFWIRLDKIGGNISGDIPYFKVPVAAYNTLRDWSNDNAADNSRQFSREGRKPRDTLRNRVDSLIQRGGEAFAPLSAPAGVARAFLDPTKRSRRAALKDLAADFNPFGGGRQALKFVEGFDSSQNNRLPLSSGKFLDFDVSDDPLKRLQMFLLGSYAGGNEVYDKYIDKIRNWAGLNTPQIDVRNPPVQGQVGYLGQPDAPIRSEEFDIR